MVETRWTYWYWHASNWWEGPPLPFLNYYFQVYRFRRSCLWIFFSLHTHVSINVNRLNTFKHILKEGSIHELSVFHVRGSGDLLTLTAAEATGKPITCFFFLSTCLIKLKLLSDFRNYKIQCRLIWSSVWCLVVRICLWLLFVWVNADWFDHQLTD